MDDLYCWTYNTSQYKWLQSVRVTHQLPSLSGLPVQGKTSVFGQRAFLFRITQSPISLRVMHAQSAFFTIPAPAPFVLEHNECIVFSHQVTKNHCPKGRSSNPQGLSVHHTKRAQRRGRPLIIIVTFSNLYIFPADSTYTPSYTGHFAAYIKKHTARRRTTFDLQSPPSDTQDTEILDL